MLTGGPGQKVLLEGTWVFGAQPAHPQVLVRLPQHVSGTLSTRMSSCSVDEFCFLG